MFQIRDYILVHANTSNSLFRKTDSNSSITDPDGDDLRDPVNLQRKTNKFLSKLTQLFMDFCCGMTSEASKCTLEIGLLPRLKSLLKTIIYEFC